MRQVERAASKGGGGRSSCGWDMVVRLMVRGRWSGQRDELFLGLLSLRSKLLQVAPAPAPPPSHMSPVLRCP